MPEQCDPFLGGGRLITGYRLTQAALKPYNGIPPYPGRLIEGSRLLHSRIYGNSPVAPSDFNRLISGYRLI